MSKHMHRTSRNILFWFLIVAAYSCQLRAVERIHVEVDPTWDQREVSATDKNFDAAISDLEHGSFDPLASEFANAEEQWTALIFNLPSLARTRAVTYRNAVGDNLLMEWDFQEPFAGGNVILRDTPYYSTFSVRLTARIVADSRRAHQPSNRSHSMGSGADQNFRSSGVRCVGHGRLRRSASSIIPNTRIHP
jgi:hypothetical protein